MWFVPLCAQLNEERLSFRTVAGRQRERMHGADDGDIDNRFLTITAAGKTFGRA